MDIQLKRGLLDICVLKALTYGDSYGYKVIKDLSVCVDISESTLYPILKRLDGNRFIEVYSIEHNGRLRKYYRITDSGREKIDLFLSEWHEVDNIYNYIKGDENIDKG